MPVHLGTCYPRVDGQEELVREHLCSVLADPQRDFAAPRPPAGDAADVEALRPLLAGSGGRFGVALTSSGQGALSAAILAVCSEPGIRVAVEEWTFPQAANLLRRIGAEVVALPMDAHGLLPEALERAGRAGARVLYTMPTMHNPLGITMPEARRQEVAGLVERFGMAVVEDEAYAFLDSDAPAPLQSYMPDRVIRTVSLSKTISLSLRLGAVVCPPALTDSVTQHLRLTGTMANPVMSATAASIVRVGCVEGLIEAKRREGQARQALAGAALRTGYSAHPSGWYGMIEVSTRGTALVEKLGREGVIVSEGQGFRADGADVQAIRVSLGGEANHKRLAEGLEIVACAVGRT